MNKYVIPIAAAPLVIWLIFSIYYLIKAKTNFKTINRYIFDSIPTIFTTTGVLGTFLGIAIALLDFDVEQITESIPPLLSGLTAAFWTSIVGIIFSIFSGKLVSILQVKNETEGDETSDELNALRKMIDLNRETNQILTRNFEKLQNSLIGESDTSLSTQITKIRTNLNDSLTELSSASTEQTQMLSAIKNSLGGDQDTSLLTQIMKLRNQFTDSFNENIKKFDEQITQVRILNNAIGDETDESLLGKVNKIINQSDEFSKHFDENTKEIITSLYSSNDIMKAKFDEFAELLAKNNTEILVQAIEEVIGDFNTKLSELIERLVKENFEELNNSVQRLNDWQKENKEQVQRLIEQYKSVSEELQLTSETMNNVADSTQKLVNEESVLQKILNELRSVMVDDQKFTQIISKVEDAINQLSSNTESIVNSTNSLDSASTNLSEYIQKEETFSKSVEDLIERLKEIEELKELNGKFWDDVEKEMKKGVGIIAGGNNDLMDKISELDDHFRQRLNDSFINLDRVLQSMTTEYHTRINSAIDRLNGGNS